MDELKPCPLCASDIVSGPSFNPTPDMEGDQNGDWWIECGECGCGISRAGRVSRDDLVRAWNRRELSVSAEGKHE